MYPVCGSGLVYCPLTDGCEVKCSVGLETANLEHDSQYKCSNTDGFCSHEQGTVASYGSVGPISGGTDMHEELYNRSR